MAVFQVFLLALVIGIAYHSHQRTYESESITINGTDTLAVKAPSNTPEKYDYFYLVLQWPQSFCNTSVVRCTSQIPDYFIVHGLWPQLNNGSITTCKSAIKLNYTELDSSVLNYMNKYWPNLDARPNNISYREWLWDHEYQRHGSCFLPFQTQPLLYFRKTVEMAKQIGSVTDMLLQKGGIQPDNYTKYRLSEFENAIFGHLKFIPRLRCNNATGSGIQLYEIQFCFKKKWAPRNCSSTFGDFRNSKCGNSQVQPDPWVMFPRPL